MSHGTGSAFRALVERGESLAALGWRIIDAHAHLGPWEAFYIPTPDAAAMVAMNERLGIGLTGLASNMAIDSDYARGNDLTAQAVRSFPGRLFGYVVPHPRYADGVLPELRRGFDELGLRAIKLHPGVHNYSILEPACADIWRFAEERRAFVLSHTWEGDERCRPKAFGQLAEEHPAVCFVLGHSGGGPAGRREAAEAARAHGNIYLEICGSRLMGADVEYLVGEVGAERVLFGTDSPWIDPRFTLGKVAYANLSDEQLRLILGENMGRLLHGLR